MNVPLFIARRYLKSSERHGYASLVTTVSFLGLVLGVVALTIVVSVMNGFDRELKSRILGAIPHIVVSGSSQEALTGFTSGRKVEAITTFKEQQVLLLSDTGSLLVRLYGISPEDESSASTLPAALRDVAIKIIGENRDAMLLGGSAARRLGLQHGDALTIVIPATGNSGNVLRPVLKTADYTGSFRLGSELDYLLAVMHVDTVSAMAGGEPDLRITMANVLEAPVLARDLQQSGFTVRDWTEDYGDFFTTVRMEKLMMFIVLSFVIAVASFSIVAGLSMSVDARRRDIAVLRTMGLSEFETLKLFFSQGALVTIAGVSMGIVIGLPLALYAPEIMGMVESVFGFSIIEGTYFDRIPTDPRLPDLLAIAVIATLIGCAATLYPALRASKLPPADILRYE